MLSREKKKHRESDIERRLVQGVRDRWGGIAYKWVSPGNDGVPDRIVVFPRGLVVFVELKTEAGRLSARQAVQIRRLQNLGHYVTVLYGMEDVEAFIEHPSDFLPEEANDDKVQEGEDFYDEE